MSAMSLDNAKKFFRYDEKFFVLICLLCKHAVRPNGMAKHLLHKHNDLPADLRKQLSDWQASLPLVNELRSPDSLDPPIEGLSIHTGILCNACDFISLTMSTMKEHQRTVHNTGTAGTLDSYSQCPVQTWFIADRVKYFQITPVPKPSHEDSASIVISEMSLIEDLIASQESKEEKMYKEMMTLSQEQRLIDHNPWLARAKFIDTLSGYNTLDLASHSYLPNDQEHKLKLVSDATQQMLEHCIESVKDLTRRDWSTILFWINSAEPGKAASKPFSVNHKKATIDRYLTLWKRFICLCFRSFTNDGQVSPFQLSLTLVWSSIHQYPGPPSYATRQDTQDRSTLGSEYPKRSRYHFRLLCHAHQTLQVFAAAFPSSFLYGGNWFR